MHSKAMGLVYPKNSNETQIKKGKDALLFLIKSLEGNVWNIRVAILESILLIVEKSSLVAATKVFDEPTLLNVFEGLFKSLDDAKYTSVREITIKVLTKVVQVAKGIYLFNFCIL
jgi:proteasome component ECM29